MPKIFNGPPKDIEELISGIDQKKCLKGFLIDSVTEHHSATTTENLSAIYHLKSRVGYSGAGIFDEKGQLITINRGGNDKYAANGIPVTTLRERLEVLTRN